VKKGFSFIEVLISVVILSFMGVAIVNFNNFNKEAMRLYLQKQQLLLLSSAMLYNEKLENDKTYQLSDIVKFVNLSDEDNKLLKSIELKGEKNFQEKVFLYNDGQKDYYIEMHTLSLEYKGEKFIPYLVLQKVKD